jgi:hypothetical protein
VERVYEHDLRAEGVVVEPLHGSTTCPAGSPSPAPHRADGSACWSTTSWPTAGSPHRRLHDETVLVTGHSYVDIWQAVRPASIGWPGGSGSSGLRLAGHQAQGAHQLAHQLSLLTRSGQQEPTERAV